MAMKEFDDEEFEDLEADRSDSIAELSMNDELDDDEDLFNFSGSGSDDTTEDQGSDTDSADLDPTGTAASVLGDTADDDSLDDDLFDFPDIFAGSRSVEEVPAATDVPAARLLDPMSMGLEGDEAESPASHDEMAAELDLLEESRPAPSKTKRAKDVKRDQVQTKQLPLLARGRLLEILAIAFLLLNTGIVLIAWQANSSFHETLEDVVRTVNESAAAGQASAEPIVVQIPAPVQEPATEVVSSTLPPASDGNYSIESLRTARTLLTKGQFMEARRRLYRLLASADASGLDAKVAMEAEYLIAESYELQGRALEAQNK